MNYKQKYLKYKNKYLNLKRQLGGIQPDNINVQENQQGQQGRQSQDYPLPQLVRYNADNLPDNLPDVLSDLPANQPTLVRSNAEVRQNTSNN